MPKRTNINPKNRINLGFIFDFSEKFFGAYERSLKRQALIITCIYSLIGSLWILLSDKLVELLIKERSTILVISIVKGWVYVFITSVLVFLLVFTAMKKVTDSKDRMKDELEKEVLERTVSLENTNAVLEETNAILEEEVMERQNKEIEIKKLNDELENRVIERTNQLQDMNTTLEEEIHEKTRMHERLQKYRILSEKANDAMLFIDKEGNILEANDAAIRIYGYTNQEFSSMKILDLRHVDTSMAIIEQMEMADKKGIIFDTVHFKKDGTIIPVEVSSQGTMLGDKRVLLSIVRDTTERKKAEEKIIYLSYHDQLTGLYNRRFYEEELRRLDTERNLPITIIMSDVNGLKLTNDAFGHQTGDILLEKIANILKRECRADEIVARVGGDEFVLLLPGTDEKEAENIVQRINVAIAKEKIDNVILSISMGFAVKKDVSEDMNEIFKKAEDDMYRHKLFESSSMRSKTIDLIMSSLYEKNSREMLHSKRVSEICEAIATKMNFEKDDVNQIRIAGLMHDIGKIGIDDNVLNKLEKLNSDEWYEIERHSEIGYRILSSVNEFSEIAEYILEQHERWNGKGYPKGLKEEEISLEARIIAVADAFDYMTSDRPYRKALSEEEAIDEIRKCSGVQFDPEISNIFIEKVLGKVW